MRMGRGGATRRVGGGSLVVAAWLVLVPAEAQVVQAPGSPGTPAEQTGNAFTPFTPALALAGNVTIQRKLTLARQSIEREAWDHATTLLQSVLNEPEDAFLTVERAAAVAAPAGGGDAKGEETLHGVSARAEADRLLGGLPAEGLRYYESHHGPAAVGLLNRAKTEGDPRLVAETARRYFFTEAGCEAAEMVAAYHLDRGQPARAAYWFDRLLSRPDTLAFPAGAKAEAESRVAPATLFRAALAFQLAGDRTRAETVWRQLASKSPDGVKFGDRLVRLPQLQKILTAQVGAGLPRPDGKPPALTDWPMFGGDAQRSARSAGAIGSLWWSWERVSHREPLTAAWLDDALRRHADRNQPVLPALFPIAASGKVVYRSTRGVVAVGASTGKRAWEAESEWSFDELARESHRAPYVGIWVNAYLSANPHVLLENAVLGALSTDGARVFAVDDIPVPPYHHASYATRRRVQGPDYTFAPELLDAALHNRLIAVDLATGKRLWTQGGRTSLADAGTKAVASPHFDSYFLGPPLPLDGLLYALVEKEQELRLVCLEPETGALSWKQPIAVLRTGTFQDPGRRLAAAPLAHGDGLLICPTNGGAIVAVDPLTHNLVWAHAYQVPDPPPIDPPPIRGRGWDARRSPPNMSTEWKTSAPVVSDGKVVFTPPDAPSIHCLKVCDGTPLWKVDRAAGDLYLAGVYDGKVLLVGRDACRALNVTDGTQAWRVETGAPSGRGIAVEGRYYLPLIDDIEDREPAIYAIDIAKGKIVDRIPCADDEVPGNLLLYRGTVFSQTLDALTGFRVEKRP